MPAARERWRCGLVFVTGRGDSVNKVVGLEIGADDYMTKPFDLRELVARVKSVLRRLQPIAAESAGAFSGNKLCFEDWQLDTAARELIDPHGAKVALTSGEFDLLKTFVTHTGRVLSRDFLLENTRGRDDLAPDVVAQIEHHARRPVFQRRPLRQRARADGPLHVASLAADGAGLSVSSWSATVGPTSGVSTSQLLRCVINAR